MAGSMQIISRLTLNGLMNIRVDEVWSYSCLVTIVCWLDALVQGDHFSRKHGDVMSILCRNILATVYSWRFIRLPGNNCTTKIKSSCVNWLANADSFIKPYMYVFVCVALAFLLHNRKTVLCIFHTTVHISKCFYKKTIYSLGYMHGASRKTSNAFLTTSST